MFNIDIRVEEMKYTNHSEKNNKYIFSFMCNFTGTSIQTQCARPNALHFNFYLECVIIFSEDYKNIKLEHESTVATHIGSEYPL